MQNGTPEIQQQFPHDNEPVDQRSEYERLFDSKKQGVKATLKAASQTPSGFAYQNTDIDNITFSSFLELPNTTPEQLSADNVRFRVPGESSQGYTVQTSGSSGVKKEIRFSKDAIIADVDPSLIDQINSSTHPILLVDKDSIDSVDCTVLKRSFEALSGKKVETEGFTYPNEALDVILKDDSDLIYTFLNPTLANLFLDGLIQMKKSGDPRIAQLMGKKFFLESGGEAIDIKQVREWGEKITELFGTSDSRIILLYGQSEQLMIGRYDYQPGDTEIKYKVKPDKLCLILDENGNPVLGEKGRLEVTRLLDQSEPIQGITVLPRYLTGDLAILKAEDGKFFLSDLERDPEKAMFSIMGEKIFLDMLPAELDKVGLTDVKLEFQELISGDRKVLRIVVVPRDNQNPRDPNYYISNVSKVLLDYYPTLAIPIKTGVMKVRVELGTESFGKKWRLLEKTEISSEDYDGIENNVIPIPSTPE